MTLCETISWKDNRDKSDEREKRFYRNYSFHKYERCNGIIVLSLQTHFYKYGGGKNLKSSEQIDLPEKNQILYGDNFETNTKFTSIDRTVLSEARRFNVHWIFPTTPMADL